MFPELQSAAAEAQQHLAQLGGAQPGKKNSIYEGAAYVAVYGQPQPDQIPQVGGGSRVITVLPLSVSRAQLPGPPVAGKNWIRTDLSPHVAYRIHWVDTHDALFYHLRLVKAGT